MTDTDIWEDVDTQGCIQRMVVPGGWIYKSLYGGWAIFVPSLKEVSTPGLEHK